VQDWDPQLRALAHLRKQQSIHLNKPSLFILVGIVVFISCAVKFGVQNTMGGCIVIAFLAVNLMRGGRFKKLSDWTRSRAQLETKSMMLEERVLQSVVGQVDSVLNFRLGAPDISVPFRQSDLVPRKVEYINCSRSLTGLDEGVAFCATYVDAGVYSEYRDDEGRIQRVPKPIFQGLFAVADFPQAKEGWVTLHTDNLESLGWLANEWRHVSDSNYVRMESVEFEKSFNVRASSAIDGHMTLTSDVMERLASFHKSHPGQPYAMALKDKTVMMLLPMQVNPFVIRDNPDLWSGELDSLREVASLLSQFVKSIGTPINKIRGAA
jgi:hypothetical protein